MRKETLFSFSNHKHFQRRIKITPSVYVFPDGISPTKFPTFYQIISNINYKIGNLFLAAILIVVSSIVSNYSYLLFFFTRNNSFPKFEVFSAIFGGELSGINDLVYIYIIGIISAIIFYIPYSKEKTRDFFNRLFIALIIFVFINTFAFGIVRLDNFRQISFQVNHRLIICQGINFLLVTFLTIIYKKYSYKNITKLLFPPPYKLFFNFSSYLIISLLVLCCINIFIFKLIPEIIGISFPLSINYIIDTNTIPSRVVELFIFTLSLSLIFFKKFSNIKGAPYKEGILITLFLIGVIFSLSSMSNSYSTSNQGTILGITILSTFLFSIVQRKLVEKYSYKEKNE